MVKLRREIASVTREAKPFPANTPQIYVKKKFRDVSTKFTSVKNVPRTVIRQ